MSAVLPLIGGLLLGRFMSNRRVAIAIQAVLYLIAAVVLIATAPSHNSTHAHGLIFAVVLAPVSAVTFALGSIWQHRTTAAHV